MEKAKAEHEAHGEFESGGPGYCGAQDTFCIGMLKGQQTFINTYGKIGFAKAYDRRTTHCSGLAQRTSGAFLRPVRDSAVAESEAQEFMLRLCHPPAWLCMEVSG